MLNEKEKQFISQWEKDREGLDTVGGKIMRGLPMALLFSLPVILLIAVIYLFFPEWYTKISGITEGTVITILIALLGSALFFAYFRMHYKWEVNEQYYLELKSREGLSETSEKHS
ncbi:MAG: hypothetical protein IPI66_08490 [Chitinophagaceae bacterium]|nr:hypothetical protein [Chitinophagaceae bacterium]MBL0056984.1 hypothetical protein [Chitinophagaceae bacterium]